MQLKVLLGISGQLPHLIKDLGMPSGIVDDATIQQVANGYKVQAESQNVRHMFYFSETGVLHGHLKLPIPSHTEA